MRFVLVLSLSFAHPADRWLGTDKIKHFVTSAFLQSAGYAAWRTVGLDREAAFTAASIGTIGIGIGKEVADRRRGSAFSVRDLTWDVAGAGAGTVLAAQAR